jgi:hypothetical protein
VPLSLGAAPLEESIGTSAAASNMPSVLATGDQARNTNLVMPQRVRPSECERPGAVAVRAPAPSCPQAWLPQQKASPASLSAPSAVHACPPLAVEDKLEPIRACLVKS